MAISPIKSIIDLGISSFSKTYKNFREINDSHLFCNLLISSMEHLLIYCKGELLEEFVNSLLESIGEANSPYFKENFADTFEELDSLYEKKQIKILNSFLYDPSFNNFLFSIQEMLEVPEGKSSESENIFAIQYYTKIMKINVKFLIQNKEEILILVDEPFVQLIIFQSDSLKLNVLYPYKYEIFTDITKNCEEDEEEDMRKNNIDVNNEEEIEESPFKISPYNKRSQSFADSVHSTFIDSRNSSFYESRRPNERGNRGSSIQIMKKREEEIENRMRMRAKKLKAKRKLAADLKKVEENRKKIENERLQQIKEQEEKRLEEERNRALTQEIEFRKKVEEENKILREWKAAQEQKKKKRREEKSKSQQLGEFLNFENQNIEDKLIAEENKALEERKILIEKKIAEKRKIVDEIKKEEEKKHFNDKKRSEEKRLTELIRVEHEKRLEKERVFEEKKLEEEKRLNEIKKLLELKKSLEEKQKLQQKLFENERKNAEKLRIAEEQRAAKEAKISSEIMKHEETLSEEAKKLMEKKRIAEEKRKAAEKRLEEAKKQFEEKKFSEEKRIAEEKIKAEQKKIENEKRQAEKIRISQEKKIEEDRKLAEIQKLIAEKKMMKEKILISTDKNENFRNNTNNLEKVNFDNKKQKNRSGVSKKDAYRILLETDEINPSLDTIFPEKVGNQTNDEKVSSEMKIFEEEKRMIERKKLEDQKILDEQNLLEKQKKLEEEKRLEEKRLEEHRLKVQKRLDEEKKFEEEKKREEEKRLEEQFEKIRMEEEKKLEQKKILELENRLEKMKLIEEERIIEIKSSKQVEISEENKETFEQNKTSEEKHLQNNKIGKTNHHEEYTLLKLHKIDEYDDNNGPIQKIKPTQITYPENIPVKPVEVPKTVPKVESESTISPCTSELNTNTSYCGGFYCMTCAKDLKKSNYLLKCVTCCDNYLEDQMNKQISFQKSPKTRICMECKTKIIRGEQILCTCCFIKKKFFDVQEVACQSCSNPKNCYWINANEGEEDQMSLCGFCGESKINETFVRICENCNENICLICLRKNPYVAQGICSGCHSRRQIKIIQ